jgi:signal transduction histidine kinase
LLVEISFNEDVLDILVKDDGVGFSSEEKKSTGIGLENIKNRAKLIGATAVFTSEINKGTSLNIVYKL